MIRNGYLAMCDCLFALAPSDFNESIEAFYNLRLRCPVLRLSIPDAIVHKHRQFVSSHTDKANHCSVPYLAYRCGQLRRFTEPLHEFIFENGVLNKHVTAQYLADLKEKWMFETDENLRFKRSRSYVSRLIELDVARWLKSEQWKIANLEMYGGQFDLEGIDKNKVVATFEIKFLAQREVIFELNMASFGSSVAAWIGVYSPIDYLIFRIYEAARKLEKSTTRRIAVAVVSDYQLSYCIPLTEGWVDWNNPSFFKKDSEIASFLSAQYIKYPNLDADLKSFISTLDEIYIFSVSGYDLQLRHHIVL